jgi:hypothetical protein
MIASTNPEPPIVNSQGHLVALGPHRRELLPFYRRWLNAFEVTRTYGSRFRTRTMNSIEVWYEAGSKGGNDFVDFTRHERAMSRPNGWTSLEEIDHGNRTGKFIILIGE